MMFSTLWFHQLQFQCLSTAGVNMPNGFCVKSCVIAQPQICQVNHNKKNWKCVLWAVGSLPNPWRLKAPHSQVFSYASARAPREECMGTPWPLKNGYGITSVETNSLFWPEFLAPLHTSFSLDSLSAHLACQFVLLVQNRSHSPFCLAATRSNVIKTQQLGRR